MSSYRYNDISLKGTLEVLKDAFTYETAKRIQDVGVVVKAMIEAGGYKACQKLFDSVQFQNLKNTTKKYDLLITEHYTSYCFLSWAWYFKIPSVAITTTTPMPWVMEEYGLSNNPSYIPAYYSAYGSEMTFIERLSNTWNFLYSRYM